MINHWTSPLCLFLALLAPAVTTGQEKGGDDEIEAKVEQLLRGARRSEVIGELDKAEGYLRDAMDLDPESAVVCWRLGEFLFREIGGPEARGLLYRAVELDPTHQRAVLSLVDSLLEEYELYRVSTETSRASSAMTAAEEALVPALEAHPESVQLKWAYGRVLRRLESPGAAEILAEVVLARPNLAAHHYEYVQAVAVEKDYDTAFARYDSLEAEVSLRRWFEAQLHANYGHLLFNSTDDDAAAMAAYDKAAYLARESAALNAGYQDAAIEHVSYFRAWKGWVQYRAGDLQGAQETFLSALGRFPQNASAVAGLAEVGAAHNAAEDLDSARELYRRACVWAPQNADFWNNLGLTARDTGHYEESYAAYRRTLELLPADPRIMNDCALLLVYHLRRDLDLAEYWLYTAMEQARVLVEAATDDATYAEHFETYGDTYANLAVLYGLRGRQDQVDEMYKQLRAIDPTRNELPPEGGTP